MSGELHVRRSGNGAPVVLLHGLFGSGGNLGALGRALAAHYAVYALDLPGHGRSPWLDRYDLPAMAAGVARWLRAEGLAGAHCVGHSLGGKVAMQLALDDPGLVRSLVIADIAPVAYGGGHDGVFAGLNAVAEAAVQSRDEAEAVLGRFVFEPGVAQFLLASLRRGDDGIYRWRMDVAGLARDYEALSAAPQTQERWPGPVLFVKGERSDYLHETQRPAIRALFPAAECEVVAGTGHWLHAEKPGEFNAIVMRFLQRVQQGAAR